ncbi:MAG: hypothetical protein HC923_02380 [Myxococcales bacterium]|nr:hypothetical protein [Myxococcales bacterium]
MGPKVLVRFTDNRSTMLSVRVRNSVAYVRLHRAFSVAPVEVLDAIASYLANRRLPIERAQLIDRYIDQIRGPARRETSRAPEPSARGQYHDLREIFGELNGSHFEGTCSARIGWSTVARKSRRRSIRLGSYCDDLALIRIHPALDQDFVPRFFVASVVFHEMLHEKHGLERDASGRRVIHSAAFRAEERLFPEFHRARVWERRYIHRLLSY